MTPSHCSLSVVALVSLILAVTAYLDLALATRNTCRGDVLPLRSGRLGGGHLGGLQNGAGS